MDNQDELYKIVTLKNVDDEDFVFQVDKVPYLFKAGETRNFPKFMANLAVKHLIDKVLEKKDKEGKLMVNSNERAKLAGRIVLGEENYEQPKIPTTQDIVEQINQPTELDEALERNKGRLHTQEPIIPAPIPDMTNLGAATMPVTPQSTAGAAVPTIPVIVASEAGVPTPQQTKESDFTSMNTTKNGSEVSEPTIEQFDGLKTPPRADMLAYAKGTLKLDIEDKKTKAAFAKMSDQELFKELQMET
jgi:hypothetical protein